MPYSSVPYSALPYSAAPYSGAPYSAPYPTRGGGRHSQLPEPGYQTPSHRPEPKPPYRDELYSTGSHASPLYPASAPPLPPVDEPAPPAYPESWGWMPEQTTTRSDRPLSPRARFSR